MRANDSTLVEIDWSNTTIDDDDLVMLAAALHSNSNVNTITLAHNRQVGNAGAHALQSVLQCCAVVAVALDVTAVCEPLKAAIRQLCIDNAVRRIAANDRGLVELDWRLMRRATTCLFSWTAVFALVSPAHWKGLYALLLAQWPVVGRQSKAWPLLA